MAERDKEFRKSYLARNPNDVDGYEVVFLIGISLLEAEIYLCEYYTPLVLSLIGHVRTLSKLNVTTMVDQCSSLSIL